jgi:hypothetical protein
MTNPRDSDEWWKQYGGQGVSPESGAPSSVPQYPTAEPSGYPSAPQYPQQPAPQMTPPPQPQPQYPTYQPQQPGAQPYPQAPNYGYQNAAYPNAYQPYGYPQSQGTSGMAIGALIASLLGFVTCGIGSIVGIILGAIAVNQIKQSGQDGRGMALAGIWIGVGVIVLSVVWFVIVVASSST